MARLGAETWDIDGKQYVVATTYYLALPDGLQFTIEYEPKDGLDATSLTGEQAFEAAFPLMKYAFEKGLYKRSKISAAGKGELSVSAIGVALYARNPDGSTSGRRVRGTLAEVEARIKAGR